MSLLEEIIGNVNHAYCAINRLPIRASGEEFICHVEDDTSAEDTALAWMRRCSESEAEAFRVLCEIEITEHGDFVQKALHLLSNVGPYTDRNKLVNELIDSMEGTLKACAANE